MEIVLASCPERQVQPQHSAAQMNSIAENGKINLKASSRCEPGPEVTKRKLSYLADFYFQWEIIICDFLFIIQIEMSRRGSVSFRKSSRVPSGDQRVSNLKI